jgi:hypothetical protein
LQRAILKRTRQRASERLIHVDRGGVHIIGRNNKLETIRLFQSARWQLRCPHWQRAPWYRQMTVRALFCASGDCRRAMLHADLAGHALGQVGRATTRRSIASEACAII